MIDRMTRFANWMRYLLQFNPVKYFGIIIMIVGPLYFFYRFLFLNTSAMIALFGAFGSFVAGLFIWWHGWDPYG